MQMIFRHNEIHAPAIRVTAFDLAIHHKLEQCHLRILFVPARCSAEVVQRVRFDTKQFEKNFLFIFYRRKR